MCDLKPKAQEDKDREIVSDSPGRIREPLQSHTFSPKNNAAGLSSDEHENPLNGTQPNPFVYSSVPAVPHAGNSLPPGALVNGPGSHPTSEVHCVLNKGTVLSNNVLDAVWQAEKDTSLEVLRPPSGLQSDAWKNTAGPTVKIPATQPGVNAPLSHSEENESKLACSALSGDGAEPTHLSRPPRKRAIKTRSQQGAEWSESSSRDYRDAEAIGRDSASEHALGAEGRHQRGDARVPITSGCLEKAKSRLNHTNALFCSGDDVDEANKEDSLGARSAPFSDYGRRVQGRNERSDPEDKGALGPNEEQMKTRPPLFFSCTICGVKFRERRHCHRHMMYHLGEHNQASKRAKDPWSFACRDCGRLFCDSYSLTKHTITHQDRREKRRNIESGAGATALQCPQCVIDCNCPQMFVQHAKTHDNLKHYYFCEECNYITLTREALEAHIHVAHRVQFGCDVGFFNGTDALVLEKRGAAHKTRSDQGQLPVELRPAKNSVACVRRENVGHALLPSLWRIDEHRKLLLQPAGGFHVATDLTCVEEDAENSGRGAFGSPKQADRAATAHFLPSARNLKLDQMFYRGSENDPASESLQVQAKQRSPSMTEMSTPLHNTIDGVNVNILPKHRQRLKKQSAVRELEKGCGGSSNFSKDTSEATGSFLESSENERNRLARGYYRERQGFPGKDQSPHVVKDEDDGDEDCSDIEQLVIKEEHIEATVCGDSPDAPRTSTSDGSDVLPARAAEHKPCPYCPAMFKSGVGLSNHVRGHLHRVGLSYNARHAVSPEQVASGDHQPRTRRRICGARKLRKVVKPEDQREFPCPLCWHWFDTKTGLSNHVRGHLKRIGGSVTGTSKSPLGVIKELLQDEKANRTVLQALRRTPFPPCLLVSPGFVGGSGFFQVRAGIPIKAQFDQPSVFGSFALPKQAATSEGTVEAQRCREAASSTLVELLKARRGCVGPAAAGDRRVYARRNFCDETKDYREEDEVAGYDYKRKTKPRPRPGLKQRIFPSLNAEIYTLTCRFCDLVFQGPLSVQEDWIKHLQRHLAHTSVPHSGTGMVEVLGPHHKIEISMSHHDPR